MKKFSLLLLFFLALPSANSIASFEQSANPSASLEPYFSRVADAIYKAENSSRYPYGIKSVSCRGIADCRRICMNTIRNNYGRWLASDKHLTFLEFLASRYAPLNALDDSNGLNRNWLKNVKYFLKEKDNGRT